MDRRIRYGERAMREWGGHRGGQPLLSAALRPWMLMGLAAVLAGCAAPPVSINEFYKDPTHRPKLDRVLVTMAFHAPALSAEQNRAFITPHELSRSFAARWTPRGVAFEIVSLDFGDDKERAAADAMARFAPRQVLELKTAFYRTVSTGTAGTTVAAYSVDATLHEAATGRRLWRAFVVFRDAAEGGRARSGPTGQPKPHQDDADDLVDLLTTKLRADGFL
jgi:hypothetical protein